MSRKAIITTILVVQLVLLILITFSTLKYEKSSFQNDINVENIASFSMTTTDNAIAEDVSNLKSKQADNETLNQYVYFVNNTFNNYFSSSISFNQTDLSIRDNNIEMQKVGKV